MSTGEWIALVLVVIGVVLAAGLAAAETSLTNLTRARARVLEREEQPGAAGLLSLLERREQVLNPVLLFRLLVQVSVAGVLSVAGYRRWGILGALCGVAVAQVLLFVIAEAIPRRWALTNRDAAGLRVAPGVAWLDRVLPLSFVTNALIRVSKVFLPGEGANVVVSEDELLAVAEWAAIESSERELIENSLDLGDTIVRGVMVPRTDMESLEPGVTVSEAIDRAIELGLSRVPILGDAGVDDIEVVAYLKDLVRADRTNLGQEPASAHARSANFVPETKRVPELLAEMQRGRFHLAIVIDEYGGVAGLITLEDLIEELVGEIADEYDEEEVMISHERDGSVLIDARTSLEDFGELLGVDLGHQDWDSLGGLVMDTLGRVPDPGDEFVVEQRRLVVVEVNQNRIGRVRMIGGIEGQVTEGSYAEPTVVSR